MIDAVAVVRRRRTQTAERQWDGREVGGLDV
jgi:hypothetical protein